MKKTLTANISGTVFHIEEDAYEQLQRYLAGIRGQFAGSEGRDEIMADIEARIAELFTERLGGRRQVVSTEDVDHVVAVMGRPEDYADGGEAPAGEPSARRRNRRLFRDPDDQWVGGVLSGIGAYFNIDPLVLRLIYVVFLLMGFGFVVYIILWMVVPQAGTSAEKLEMRGETVNVENIKRVFQEGAERLEKGAAAMAGEARKMGSRMRDPRVRRSAENVFGLVGEALRLVLVAIGKFIGLVLLAVGTLLAILLMVLVLGKFSLIWDVAELAEGTSLHDIALLIVEKPKQVTLIWMALIGLLLVPVIGLVQGGINLLFGVKTPKWFNWGLAPVWIGSMVILGVVGGQLGNQFRVKETLKETIELVQPEGRTLSVSCLPDPHFGNGHRDHGIDLIKVEGDEVHVGWATLDVRQSPDHLYRLVVERRARGAGAKEAGRRAGAIRHAHQQIDSTLLLTPWLTFGRSDLYRGQNVRFIIEVPVGKAVHFNPGSERMIDDIHNVTNTYDPNMVGRTWTMTPKGLDHRVRPEDVTDDQPATVAPAETVGISGTDAAFRFLAVRNRAVPFHGPRPQRPATRSTV